MSDSPHVTSWSPVIDEGETIAALRSRLATAEGLLREARPIIHAGAQREIDAGVNLTDVICGTGGLLISIDEFLTPTPPVGPGAWTAEEVAKAKAYAASLDDVLGPAPPTLFDALSGRAAAAATYPTPSPCASWCGRPLRELPYDVTSAPVRYDEEKRFSYAYCTPACRDTGRALNPPCATCGNVGRTTTYETYDTPCPTCSAPGGRK